MKNDHESDDPRRRLLIKALTAGLFSTALPGKSVLADSLFGMRPSKLPSGQSIYRINGSATVNGKEATVDTRVGPNDTIQTGKNSEIIFVVGGNSILLRGDTHLVMQGKNDSAAPAATPDKKDTPPVPKNNKEAQPDSLVLSGLRLLSGKLLSVSRNQVMRIQTPTATVGIRGTGVYLEADPELTYFCNCYGTTDISSNSDPASTDTIVSQYHKDPKYITSDGQAGKNLRPAPFINHTDQELMLVEALVGRTPPFVFPGDDYDAPRRDY